MAHLGETFQTSDLPEGRSYDLIPEGWYTATITKADLGQTKSGTGQKIDLRYDITGPAHQGRVVFASLNIRNQSQKAEEIGRQQLGDLMRAIGLAKVQDTDELIGGTLSIKIKIKPAENGYEARNEVSGVKAIDGSAPPRAATPSPSMPTATAGAAPPWAKR
jgi:hypothetical protein